MVDLRERAGRRVGAVVGRAVTRTAGDRRVRYLFAGAVAAIVFYGSFAAGWLASAGQISYLLLTVLANLVTALSTYPLYRSVVFAARGPWVGGFVRFYLTCLGSLGFALAGMPVLVELAGVPVLAAQAILIVLVPLVNYQVNKYWTFRK
jgi:putative flippase GtrA